VYEPEKERRVEVDDEKWAKEADITTTSHTGGGGGGSFKNREVTKLW